MASARRILIPDPFQTTNLRCLDRKACLKERRSHQESYSTPSSNGSLTGMSSNQTAKRHSSRDTSRATARPGSSIGGYLPYLQTRDVTSQDRIPKSIAPTLQSPLRRSISFSRRGDIRILRETKKKGQTLRSDLEEAATYSPTGKPQYHRRE